MKILTPDFERLDVETDAQPQTLVVSDDAIQSIARLFVYDPAKRIWTALRATDGTLNVGQETAYATSFFVTTVGLTELLVLNANPTRRSLVVKNTGGSAVYLSNQTPVQAGSRLTLLSGETVTLTGYIDFLYAVSVLSTTITLIESRAL